MAMVQAISYNFSTVETPLSDGGNFTIVSDAIWTGLLKAISGTPNTCVPTTTNKNAAAFYSGSIPAPSNAWPADQYWELTLSKWAAAGDTAYLLLRQGTVSSGTRYLATLVFTTQQFAFDAIVGGVVYNLVPLATQASAVGDIFRFSVTGNILSLSRNGTVVQTFTDTNNYIAAGSPGFGLLTTGLSANVQTALVAGGANQSATPTFSPVAGSYSGTQTVTITSASGGTIYYTTDGTTPTHASSSIASGSTISVAATETVKAIASATNNLDSAVGSAAYTIITPAATQSGTGRNIVDVGESFATQIRSPRTSIIGTNLKTKII